MSIQKERLIKKRNNLLRDVEENLDFIKGSITKVSRKNRIIGDFYHLTYKDEIQKTHTKYIPGGLVKEVKNRIKKMNKINKLINKISKLNIEALKTK